MRRTAILAAALFLSATPVLAKQPVHWVGTWASAQQVPEPNNALPPEDLTDATLRQIVHISAGGTSVRVRVSNAFGTQPLHVASAHIANALSATSPQVDTASDHALTFLGQTDVIIPAGAEYWSDPVAFDVAPLSSLAVSLYIPDAPAQQTSHPGSRATSYLVHGNHAADATLDAPKTVDHWFQLSGIDITGPSSAVVTVGDSITDGRGSTTNGNDRWPDQLAARLQASKATHGIAVMNTGIGGNRVLNDGLGPNAAARFSRDVVAQSGARYVIVLEGVNDLGTLTRDAVVTPEAHAALVQQIELAYSQMIELAHSHGIRIFGGTIMPYGGSDYYHPDAQNEADRQAINTWIRMSGRFDGVADFDAAVRDPDAPDHLLAAYDSGDHLHLSPAGYKAMADAIDLNLFN